MMTMMMNCSCFVSDCGCISKGIPVLDGLERGRQSSGSEPDKGIIEPWRLG